MYHEFQYATVQIFYSTSCHDAHRQIADFSNPETYVMVKRKCKKWQQNKQKWVNVNNTTAMFVNIYKISCKLASLVCHTIIWISRDWLETISNSTTHCRFQSGWNNHLCSLCLTKQLNYKLTHDIFYFSQAVDALRNSPIIAQLVVEKGTAEDLMTNSSGPPTPQESRYGAVQYSHYHASSDSYNGTINVQQAINSCHNAN